MKLQVSIYPSDEGFAVCVPSLPGCWSQGATQAEAMENIRDAIREYIDAGSEPPHGQSSGAKLSPDNGPTLSEAAEICEVELAD